MRSLQYLGLAALAALLSSCFWPAPGYGPDRRSFNPAERTLTVDNVATLRRVFVVHAGDRVSVRIVGADGIFVAGIDRPGGLAHPGASIRPRHGCRPMDGVGAGAPVDRAAAQRSIPDHDHELTLGFGHPTSTSNRPGTRSASTPGPAPPRSSRPPTTSRPSGAARSSGRAGHGPRARLAPAELRAPGPRGRSITDRHRPREHPDVGSRPALDGRPRSLVATDLDATARPSRRARPVPSSGRPRCWTAPPRRSSSARTTARSSSARRRAPRTRSTETPARSVGALSSATDPSTNPRPCRRRPLLRHRRRDDRGRRQRRRLGPMGRPALRW